MGTKVMPDRAVAPKHAAEDGVDLGVQTMRELLTELDALTYLRKVLMRHGEPMHGTLHALQQHAHLASQLAEACLVERE